MRVCMHMFKVMICREQCLYVDNTGRRTGCQGKMQSCLVHLRWTGRSITVLIFYVWSQRSTREGFMDILFVFFFKCCRDSPLWFPCTINYLLSKHKKNLPEALIHTLNILLLPETSVLFPVMWLQQSFFSVTHSTPKKDSRFQFMP